MKLELEPLDDDERQARLLSQEEREWMIRRIKDIPPEALQSFDAVQRREIQTFLYRLISLSEQLHHDMLEAKKALDKEAHEGPIRKLSQMRQELCSKASPAVERFIQLVDLGAMEPWLEWEVFIGGLQHQLGKEYFQTKNTSGMAAAKDNPFLLQVDDARDEEVHDHGKAARLAPVDIERVIFHFPLEELVSSLIHSRKVITGLIWEGDYDL